MEKLVKGSVVVVPFPFSNLIGLKRRPALVVSVLEGNDLILCQITSRHVKDDYAIGLGENEFKNGSLRQESNVRPNKLFTADSSIIEYSAGILKEEKTKK